VRCYGTCFLVVPLLIIYTVSIPSVEISDVKIAPEERTRLEELIDEKERYICLFCVISDTSRGAHSRLFFLTNIQHIPSHAHARTHTQSQQVQKVEQFSGSYFVHSYKYNEREKANDHSGTS